MASMHRVTPARRIPLQTIEASRRLERTAAATRPAGAPRAPVPSRPSTTMSASGSRPGSGDQSDSAAHTRSSPPCEL